MKTINEEIISNADAIYRIRNQPKKRFVLKSGLTNLDEKMQGFHPGELIIITGYTKMGKSLMAKTLTRGFSDAGVFPLFFEYEEPVEQFLESFPNMSEDMIFFMPDKIVYNDVKWLLGMITKSFEYDVKVVFIDHLHFLFDFRTMHTNTAGFIGDFVRDIKKFAIDNQIIVFLICHTKKAQAEGKQDMSASAIRDSGLIPALSDSVLFVHRDIQDTGTTRTEESFVKICMHRRTGVYDETIYIKKNGKFLVEV